MKTVKVDVDWNYVTVWGKYTLIDKNGDMCTEPIGKYCAILKRYTNTDFYTNENWGYLSNVLYSICEGIPVDFDGDVLNSCHLIRIESVL